jgi:multicomponent Na+:H+ antiporter subunit C
MSWVLAAAIGATVAAGVYLALARDLLRVVIGVSLIGAAANLSMFAAGRTGTMTPPVVPAGETLLAAGAANPLPQALVLTAIVIGFALTCFSLVLVLAVKQDTGTADSAELRAAEPLPAADGKPPLEDAGDAPASAGSPAPPGAPPEEPLLR